MTPTERRRLIPLWMPIAAAAVLVLIVVAVVLILARQKASLVSVPSVVGSDVAAARSRLGQAGLLLEKGDTRFSASVPKDGVLEQDPAPGALIAKGSSVKVVLSGGSSSFPLPDVTGMPLTVARTTLQDKGLVVQTEVVASERPKNVVVSSLPGPGVIVTTADVVKLTVSSGGKGTGAVKPTDLTGRTFVIDPVPVSGTSTDTPMEVQRRLQSLLSASGATVVVTRSLTETQALESLRASRAAESSPTAVIGLAVTDGTETGMRIFSLGSTGASAPIYLGTQQLVTALTGEIGKVGGVKASEIASDTVLGAGGSPGVRILLGSVQSEGDRSSFADPAWADSVARAIYSSIASVYGGGK